MTLRRHGYERLCHAFAGFTGAAPAAQAARRGIVGRVRDAYREGATV